MKSIALVLAVAVLANTRLRIQAVLWMVVVSIGYYGVRGGLFVIGTGGSHQVFGPDDTMIGDNNNLGLALAAILPLILYLKNTSRVQATRLAALATLILSVVAVFGTYSRGALVALAAVVAGYAMKSRAGVLLVLVAASIATVSPHVMPQQWLARMSTIRTAEADQSFAGRVAAWKTSYAIAIHRPLGGGFAAVQLDDVAHAFPTEGGLTAGRAAHSIYFEALGDHGFVGLALYLSIFVAAWLNASRVQSLAHQRPDLAWANQLARMLQVSILAFLVGGAALSMAYYDGMLILLALTAALLQVATAPRAAEAGQSAPAWRLALDRPARSSG